MKALEFLKEYYSVSDDEGVKKQKSDTRRPKLTLRHLNKLRRVRELKRLENANHKKLLPQIYGQPATEE